MKGRKNILIIDDEWTMRNLLKIYLSDNEFNIFEASNGVEALEQIKLLSDRCDLVILDLMMPIMDGFEFCQKIRMTSAIPILMLSARKDLHDKVMGLNLGADDYLVKPFEPEELVARVQALLRRVSYQDKSEDNGDLILTNGLQIIFNKRQVFYKNNQITLTAKEFDLLYKLASAPGRVYSREDLLQLIWDDEYIGATRTVDSHIKNIRSKLELAGILEEVITTVWGIGYKFN
ncbi:PhoP family transcriptional regulator [Alkalihalobacillus alcalophilus ATCC 27647 = CGMCC 1.3604]|uniref:Transcriptional regulator n=1 Tax=Alkalihalobacillus alcalophilus ATCC 27647 = CGMCC 1.3604 TaxID=1218173 RepID=A0A094YT45_ALKAL|nr:response regulator transcription factor [Alkalihalobacillus alcalophilus]KGA96647.1 transcriptional regulator [Alkalihalobacillus alcalophilus ATCC 27647 = CGMCC 1.3604]MED1561842.1 response regulator transcription factor [Alkalihalobacillus alcalophilus]THG91006.1 PhoP family transcriptional regulator [Alkalihalobacillus alcalophilus ATCC 27647 = CGMCC 1.3604]